MSTRLVVLAVAVIICSAALIVLAAQFGGSSQPRSNDFPVENGFIRRPVGNSNATIYAFGDGKTGLKVPVQLKGELFPSGLIPKDLTLMVRLEDSLHENWYVGGVTGLIDQDGSMLSVDGPVDADDPQTTTEIDLLGLIPSGRYNIQVHVLPRHGEPDVKQAQEAINSGQAFSVDAYFMK